MGEDIDIQEALEDLAEALVLADPSDPRSLAELQMCLERAERWAAAAAHPAVADAAASARRLVGQFAQREISDPRLCMEAAERAFADLQALVRDRAGFGTPPVSPEPAAPAPEALDEPEPAAPSPPNPFSGDASLLADFISEATEHLDTADLQFLAIETNPRDAEALNATFRALHTIKGSGRLLGLDEIVRVAHAAEDLLDRARQGTLTLCGEAMDVSFDAVDAMKRLLDNLRRSLASGVPAAPDPAVPSLLRRIRDVASRQALASAEDGRPESPPSVIQDVAESPARTGPPERVGKKLGDILVESGKISRESLEATLNAQDSEGAHAKLGELLVQTKALPAKEVAVALRSQKAQASTERAAWVKEAIRVDADRLDRLLDTIGELVIAESMASQSVKRGQTEAAQLVRQLTQLDKITRELQEMATSLRMIPMQATFQKMARLVRDLARKAGKQVELVTVGEETELDKSVVDRVGDPLVHMLRNAVDHGIEDSPEERVRAGKPPVGRIELRAFHKGGGIFIEIQDDGRGLDREAILAKAVEHGIVRDGDPLSDQEVWSLIFRPGFSTSKKVTDVSGRGVGMDVVKRTIEALRGQIDIASERGKGALFTIRLPLTLAIIDGMAVRAGKERYMIPTLSVIRLIRPKQKDLSTVLDRGEMLMVEGKLLPVFRLNRLFETGEADQDLTEGIVVVVEDDGRQAGIVIHEILDQQQIVIKSLGEGIGNIPGIAGGGIMPDGRVGLILDVGGLMRLAHVTAQGEAENAAE